MHHCSQMTPQSSAHQNHSTLERTLEAKLTQWLHAFKGHQRYPILFGSLLDQLDQVIIRPLSRNELVNIIDRSIYIDNAYIQTLSRSEYAYDYQVQCAMLYAIHELFHCAHNIDKRPAVIRRISESLLMKFDLEADHYAALLLSEFYQEWSILELKKTQVLCLEDFPVMKRHTERARRRKALRLVSLRLECALRARGMLSEHERGDYVVVHLEGDQGLVMLEGLISKVFATPKVSEEESAFLLSVADQTTSEGYAARLKELDLWVDALIDLQ